MRGGGPAGSRAASGTVGATLLLACAVLVGCAGAARGPGVAPPRVSLSAPPGARGAHHQIVRALGAGDRGVIAERFRTRNGPGWTIALGAGGAPDDVDPIRGIVRRARNEAAPGPRVDVTDPVAVAEGEAFLAKNADLLGFAAADVPALDMAAGPARTATYGSWVVHVRGHVPMRGYEGFESVATAVDVLLYLGDDARVRYFVNLSHAHPHLDLDTAPLLGPDDVRLLRSVVGRELFVVIDDPARPGARVRELRRVSLGHALATDVRAVRLTIHAWYGPRASYASYRLAYAVDVVRRHQAFRFVVDADTGELLDDAAVPVVGAPPEELAP